MKSANKIGFILKGKAMKKFIIIFLSCLVINTNAYALTACDAILQQGIYDINDTLSENQKHQVAKRSWCRTNEKERGGGLGFSIKKIFSLNGKGKKSDINKFCQSNFNDIKNDQSFININRQINTTIVNAWVQCIGTNNQQVSHYIKPTHSPDKIIYGIVFKPDRNGNPPRAVKLNYWAVSGARCPVNFNGKLIDQNIFEVTCTRSPKNTVIVNARSSSYGHNLRTVQIQPYQKPAPIVETIPNRSPVAPALPRLLTKETRANEDGQGDNRYLDRHHVSCHNQALSSFRLIRPTKSTIAYQYRCGNSMRGITGKKTQTNNDGGGDSRYLDRQTVNCGNTALLGFRLIRPTKSTIAYQYSCGTKKLKNITNHETRATVDGGGDIRYLDRQAINCGNRIITKFRLFRPTNSTVAYQFSCGSQ